MKTKKGYNWYQQDLHLYQNEFLIEIINELVEREKLSNIDLFIDEEIKFLKKLTTHKLFINDNPVFVELEKRIKELKKIRT